MTTSHVGPGAKPLTVDGLLCRESDNRCSEKLQAGRTPRAGALERKVAVTFSHADVAFSNDSHEIRLSSTPVRPLSSTPLVNRSRTGCARRSV